MCVVKLYFSTPSGKDHLIDLLFREPWARARTPASVRARTTLSKAWEDLAAYLYEHVEENLLRPDYETTSELFLDRISKQTELDLYCVLGDFAEQEICNEWLLETFFDRGVYDDMTQRIYEMLRDSEENQ
jgi:hypothetical protein